jgi:hypothetical protein
MMCRLGKNWLKISVGLSVTRSGGHFPWHISWCIRDNRSWGGLVGRQGGVRRPVERRIQSHSSQDRTVEADRAKSPVSSNPAIFLAWTIPIHLHEKHPLMSKAMREKIDEQATKNT